MSNGRFGWSWGLGLGDPYTLEHARKILDEILALIDKTCPEKLEGHDIEKAWRERAEEPWDKGDRSTLFEPFYWLQGVLDPHGGLAKWAVDVGEGWIGFGLRQRVSIPAEVVEIAAEIGKKPHYHEYS